MTDHVRSQGFGPTALDRAIDDYNCELRRRGEVGAYRFNLYEVALIELRDSLSPAEQAAQDVLSKELLTGRRVERIPWRGACSGSV